MTLWGRPAVAMAAGPRLTRLAGSLGVVRGDGRRRSPSSSKFQFAVAAGRSCWRPGVSRPRRASRAWKSGHAESWRRSSRRLDAADQRADRQRKGVAAADSAREPELFGQCAAGHAFMPITPICRGVALGHDLLLEAAVVGVEDVDRHLDGVPLERLGEHLQVVGKSLWPVKPMKRTLPAFGPPGRP